jgi:hypothetical protein
VPTALDNEPDQKNIADEQFQGIVDKSWSKKEQEKLKKSASNTISGDQLEAGEQEARQPATSNADETEKAKGGWFSDKGGKRSKRFEGKPTKRQAIGGGIAGLTVGLILAGLGVVQGPAQIIQVSGLVSSIFFSRNNDTNDISVRRLYNFATSQREKNQLGPLASLLATKQRGRLAAEGVNMVFETANGKGRAKLQALEVDPNSEKGSKMLQRARAKGGQITEVDGKFRIDMRGFDGGVIGRDLIAFNMELDGKKGITGLIAKRRLKRLAGVSFHPLNIGKRATETYHDYLRRRRSERANEASHGSSTRNIGTPDGGLDEDGNPKPVDSDVGNDGKNIGDTISDINNTTDPLAKRDKLLNVKSLFKTGATGAAIVAVVCAVRDMGDGIQKYKMANVVLPLIRIVMQYVAAGSQVQAMQDIDLDEVGTIVDPLYDEETGTSYAAAMPLKAAMGESGGEDIDPAIRSQIIEAYSGKKPLLFEKVDNIPYMGAACGFNKWVGNLPGIKQFGEVSNWVISGLSSIATGRSIEDWMASLVAILAGGAIDTLAEGAKLGNFFAYGGVLSANAKAIAQGSGTLTPLQNYEWQKYSHEQRVAALQERSFTERMFDINSHESLAGGVMLRMGSYTNIRGLANATQRGPANILKSPFDTITKLFTPKAIAQTIHDYDYGLPEFGIPLSRLNSERYEDIYENIDRLEDNDFAKLKEANKNWGKCFGHPIDDTGKVIDRQLETYEEILADDCKANYGNQDFQDYQMYILDNVSIKSLACYEGVSEASCNEMGIGNVSDGPLSTGSGKIEGNPYTDSTSVACVAGTQELPGVHDAYSNGVKYSVKLCALPNLPSSSIADNPGATFSTPGASGFAIVNSRVSGAWFALVNDAKSAGISLTASSSFRSMPHQQDICQSNTACRNGDYTRVAQPGYSSHQAGVAIDFAGIEGEGGQDCGAGRARHPTNSHWQWLHDNAEHYGFKQYSAEAWHWDALPTANRCGASS